MSTSLNCPQWMQNQKGHLPCQIGQELGQKCNQTYTVSLVDFQESIYIPNATSTNGCTCSWSIYNLLSACSYCLGQDQYPSWSSWITTCGSNSSTTSYFPYNVSDGIPFWAAHNPSSWSNGVFDITQAGNIGEAGSYFSRFNLNFVDYSTPGNPDVYGGSLPSSTATSIATSTSTSTVSSSSVPTGTVIGSVIGGVGAVIVGGLFVFWVMRRRRHKKTHAASVGVPCFTVQTTTQPTLFGNGYTNSPYLTSSVHSTTSLEPTSLTSPISSGFSSNEHRIMPITDAADMITPFLATPSMHRNNHSNSSLQKGKASDSVSDGRMTPPAQRVRMNPPSYLDSVEAGPSQGARSSRRTHNKQNSSMSGVTSYSAHSRTSTWESMTRGQLTTRIEQSRPRAATPVVETASSADGVDRVHGDGKTGAKVSHHRPPAV